MNAHAVIRKMSIYSDSAPLYRENGLSVVPCGPGTKFPGRYTKAHGWSANHDWQKYCRRQPSHYEYEIWENDWPEAGICAPLGPAPAPKGMILIAVDIDTDQPEEVAAIKGVLPGSPCAKRGAKGETQFYLASPAVKNKPFNGKDKRRILDLLADGRQTVMPPSIHPDCQHCGAKGTVKTVDMACGECGAIGQAYRWITPDTLETFDIASLPVLPDNIVEILGEALAPFGYEPPIEHEPGAATLPGLNIHRELNGAGLANLDAWVPALGLYKCRKVGSNYKAVASWRPSSSGRPDTARNTNLAISPQGIKDCGEDKGYTPLDLVMAALSCDLDTAFRFLRDRVAPLPPLKLTAKAAVAESGRGNLKSERYFSGNASLSTSGQRVSAQTSELLPLINPASWQGMPIPEREWLLDNWIPMGQATLFTGAGATGKSLMAQQLATHVALGRPFMGTNVRKAVALYITCEDDAKELHRRQVAICRAMGIELSDLDGRLSLCTLVGKDNALATFDRDGNMAKGKAFYTTHNSISAIGAGFTVIDNVAHTFAGNEIVKNHVAAFCNLLNGLAADTESSVLFVAHPNKAGDEYSGNVAWENQVRARIYLSVPCDDTGNPIDADERVLTTDKANYSRKGAKLNFRWHNWAFVSQNDMPTDDKIQMLAASADRKAEDAFLACLRERNRQNRAVSEKRGPNYAPTQFAGMSQAKGVSKNRLAAAMDRLFAVDKITRAELWRGSDRKPVFGLRETDAGDAGNAADPADRPGF